MSSLLKSQIFFPAKKKKKCVSAHYNIVSPDNQFYTIILGNQSVELPLAEVFNFLR